MGPQLSTPLHVTWVVAAPPPATAGGLFFRRHVRRVDGPVRHRRRGLGAHGGAAAPSAWSHGDVHAGNLLLLRDGRVGVIDWGIVGRLDRDTHMFFRRIVEAALGDEDAWSDIAAHTIKQYGALLETGMGMNHEDTTAFMRMMLEPLLKAPFGEVSLVEILNAPQAKVAEAKGLPVRALGIAFMVMLALVVTMAVQVVGTLLLFALVVSPAATAIAITARPSAVVAIGTAIGLGAVWAGLVASAMFNLPPSFPIVAIVFVGWLITLGLTRDRGHGAASGDIVHDHHHPPETTNLSI